LAFRRTLSLRALTSLLWFLICCACRFPYTLCLPGSLLRRPRFRQQRLHFGSWNIPPEHFLEILLHIPFGLRLADPDRSGPNFVRTQLVSQPGIVDFFAL